MKHLKWLLSMFLCFMILLVGCVDEPAETTDIGNKQTDEISTNQTEANETKPPEPDEFVFAYGDDEELAMAYEKGFVPKALWGKMGENVSLSDFVNMVRAIAAEENAAVLAEFDGYMGEAGNIAAPADRSLASIVLYYATYLLEVPERTWFSLLEEGSCWATDGPGLNNYLGDRWDEFKYLHTSGEFEYYGVFPRAADGGYAWDDFWDGDVSTAAYFSMLARSTFEGRMYFDYDFAENTMHMDRMVSVEEAVRAAARFYMICHGEEMFMETIREHNAASPHKQPIEDYDVGDLVDSIGVGIHFNHAQTGWLDFHGLGYIDMDSLWDVMTTEWEVQIGRDNAKAVLKAYKEKGFDTIRMQVNFTPYMNPETHEINTDFLEYLEYWVNLILDEDMYVVIVSADIDFVDDAHTEDWMQPEYRDKVNTSFEKKWVQVAEHFKDYDERLMFEPINEPQDSAFPDIDNGQYEYQTERINELNKIFVDAFRESGGNNAKRTLHLVPLWGQFFMETLVPLEDDYVVATYHTYFSHFGALSIYGFPTDQIPLNEFGNFTEWSSDHPILRSWIDRTYEQIRVFKETYGIPVIIGEYSPSLAVSEEDAIDMVVSVMEIAHEHGCPVIFWDGYFGDNGESDVGFYHLGRDEWHNEKMFDEMMRLAEARKK